MATNALGPYAEIEYAQEALVTVHAQMGMARRVYMQGSDTVERRGNTITFAQPSTFEAIDVPDTSQQAVEPGDVSLVLDQHKGVEFGLSSKELATSRRNIVEQHILPAGIALADKIDQTLCGLYVDVPWFVAGTATPTDVTDITTIRRGLFERKVPFSPGAVHLMLDGEREEKFLRLAAFTQQQGAAQVGVDAQLRGALGTRFGMDIFANQNVKTHATTAVTKGGNLQLNANAAAGATSIVIKDSTGSLTGTIAKGDSFVIAGNTQRYVATANATATSNLITLSVSPGLAQAYSENDVITLRQAAVTEGIAFHRNAFALGFARLGEDGNGRGAQVATVRDPVTGLAVRMTMWFDANNDKMKFRLDALWGVKTLNGNLALRYGV